MKANQIRRGFDRIGALAAICVALGGIILVIRIINQKGWEDGLMVAALIPLVMAAAFSALRMTAWIITGFMSEDETPYFEEDHLGLLTAVTAYTSFILVIGYGCIGIEGLVAAVEYRVQYFGWPLPRDMVAPLLWIIGGFLSVCLALFISLFSMMALTFISDIILVHRAKREGIRRAVIEAAKNGTK